MKAADQATAAAGIPAQLLMEAAGRAVADSVLRNFPACRRPLLLCGKGNNGGDGYVAARYLRMAGREPTVLEMSREPVSEDAATARAACLAYFELDEAEGRDGFGELEPNSVGAALTSCDLVIDALLGSGLARPVEGRLAALIARVGSAGLPVLSIDVPSGISADEPFPAGPHLVASVTVQLAGPKLASAFDPARGAFGRQEIAHIGIPAGILDAASGVRLLTPGEVSLPRRERDAHKYQVGTVLVVAGSPRYLGAAELACRGAYRAGAGLVTLASEARLPSSWPEIIFAAIDWDDDPASGLRAIEPRRAQAIVAGPGLDARSLATLPGLIAGRPVPWVLDAGALRPSNQLQAEVREHGDCVLTPHHGEAAILLDCGTEEIKADAMGAASKIAADWNATCVLKGGSTVIAGPRGSLAVSTEGHAGMATGGTGDVLAGVIGAFLAAGGDVVAQSEAAVAVHGRAGLLAGKAHGTGMTARDLIAELPRGLRQLGHPGP